MFIHLFWFKNKRGYNSDINMKHIQTIFVVYDYDIIFIMIIEDSTYRKQNYKFNILKIYNPLSFFVAK